MKSSKKEIKDKIEAFFKDLGNKSSEEIKKLKKLSMSINFKLKDLRKNFCKKCYSPLISGITCEVRIKKGFKICKCKICKTSNRWKLK